MSLIAIAGAGDLAGALAHTLVARGRVGEIRLIDPAEGVAAGKALDLQQAATLHGSATEIRAASDWWAAAGARVIVVADAAGAIGEWQGEAGAATVRRLAELAPRACLVFAGPAQRELIERAATELGVARERLLGSAPAGFAAAVRALVALELGVSHADVALAVTGAPPEKTVIGWSQAAVRGVSLSDLVTPPALAQLARQALRLWPPGPYTAAAAAARIVEALATGGSPRVFTCFVPIEDEWPAARGRVVAMPVQLGPGRVAAILPPRLSRQEQVQFENAIAR